MSNQTQFDKVEILGVDIDLVNRVEAVEYVIAAAQPGRPAVYVVKPYVEFLDRSYHDLEVQNLLNNAELTIADGIAVVWAAAYLYAGPRTTWRFLKTVAQIVVAPHELLWPLTDRAAGTNFTWPLLQAAARANLRVALVGTPRHSTLDDTAAAIKQRMPAINLVLTHTGTDPHRQPGRQSRAWLDQLALQLRDARADIILLGLGFPRQEYAASYLQAQLAHGVLIGEGGTFDYREFGGHQAKAAAWIQRSGLEWLWRLVLEPRRLRRQLAIPRFMWRVWRSRH
ncbi:MAG TPA: WecB/TagA/CpsF family glycosyltransferase [Candidatus Saccharimonadia bacterium]